MSVPKLLLALGLATLAAPGIVDGQALEAGPTIGAARSAFFVGPVTRAPSLAIALPSEECGSRLKNAVMLGLGASLAVGVIELTYTLIREPFVRNGSDWPAADPMLIAWGGAAGFVIGLVGTEMCRRR